jgi:Ca2+-binding RTX toxin-like protein
MTDIPGHTGSPARIDVGGTYLGTFENRIDTDAVGFAAVAGVTYRLTLDQGAFRGPASPAGSPGALFVNDQQPGLGRGFLTAQTDGLMFIQVSPGRSPSGPYTLTLDEVPGDLSPFAAQAAPLALGTTVQGRNDFAYDTDAYAVTLAAGQRYAITVTEDATGTTNQIRLNDASGNPVLGEFLSTPGSRTLLVTAAASGMHDLRVQGWDGVGPYTLRVDPSADLPAGIDTPAVIAIGQTVDETFEHPGDRDWFAVDLVAGASYAFTLEQAGSFLRLLDAAGRPVQSTGTGDLTMPVTVEQAGRYFIEAATGALNAGPYRLTAAATDETPANPTTPAVLAAGETLTGALTALDADWFAVALAPDTTYRVTATRPAGAETVLSVHDAAGRTRAEQRGDDGAPLVFSTGTAGARFIGIRDAEGAASDYTLRYEAVADVGQTPAGAVSVAPGAAWSGHLFRGDRDMFALDAGPGDYTITLASSGPGVRPSLLTVGGPATVRDVDLGAQTHRVAITVAEGAAPVFLLVADPVGPAPVRPFYTLAVSDATLGTPGDDRLTAPADSVTHALEGDDTILGQDGGATILAGLGDDIVFAGSGADSVLGGLGRDALHLGAGDDHGEGGTGDDLLVGNAGNDTLAGNYGADTLIGGPGDDFLNPGHGEDQVRGGAGADRFWSNGWAVGFDHSAGTDWIADYSYAEGDVLALALGTFSGALRVERAGINGAGDPGVNELVIFDRVDASRPLWILVDGDAQDRLRIDGGSGAYDLML